MPRFSIQALKIRELSEAWPIVRSSNSHANVDWWIASASEVIEHGGGVLVARAADDRIHGFATFEFPRNLARERVLAIPTLITFELSRSAPARGALLKALQRIASNLCCTHAVHPVAGPGVEAEAATEQLAEAK